MKISYTWLKNFIDTNATAIDAAELLTSCGLEVESVESHEKIKGGLKGVVTGEVKSCSKHPDADKLSITQVDVGTGSLLNIVCGAPNVAVGQKVLVATVGSTLYPGGGEALKIKKSKIRGAESEGMICAEDELGLGTSHAGIMVLPAETSVGIPAATLLKIESEEVFEIGLTPNRPDAASHVGVARDLSAAIHCRADVKGKFSASLKNLPKENSSFKKNSTAGKISVEVNDTKSCPRYAGMYFENINVQPSPDWLVQRLNAIGVKPINNVVDITNYLLHSYGQPLHAFDADKISGNKIIVRKAKAGETMITLDNAEQKFSDSDLLICNAENGMCIAGVFGGKNSGITSETKNVFLESAFFESSGIRKTSKSLGLKTDASFRYERGADVNMVLPALHHAAELFKEIAGGSFNQSYIDIYPEKINQPEIEVSHSGMNSLIGKNIPVEDYENIFYHLGIDISEKKSDGWKLKIPLAKVDVLRQADVAEEVLRIYGYNNIEFPEKLNASLSYSKNVDKEKFTETISSYLSNNGFYQIFTNSLSKSKYAALSGIWKSEEDVKIQNALSSDLDVLRQSLLYTGLEAIAYNRNRKQLNLKFYETGKTYHLKNNRFSENEVLAMWLTGDQFETSWQQSSNKTDIYFLKTYVQQMLMRSGVDQYSEKINTESSEIFAMAMDVVVNQKVIGTYGQLQKKHAKNFDINTTVWYAEFNLPALIKVAKTTLKVKEVSKYPQVERDLSMLIDSATTFADIQKIALATEKKLLRSVNLFDVYEGEKIAAGKKSYALSFTLLDEEQTLTDDRIDQVMTKLMNAFEKEAGAVIRKN